MLPKVAGRILSEMDIDVSAPWITRMDAAVATSLLEAMPPPKAAKLLERIESSRVQDLLNRMRSERAFLVRKSIAKLGEDKASYSDIRWAIQDD
jgi:flagellar motility protein MotE (MotC chaperone)